LIQNYIRFAVKALKGQFIALKMIAEDLFMKREYVVKRIFGLIGDNTLTGKIDLNYDIYIEGNETLDTKTIANLDLIKATNVKTYLFFERLLNIFRNLTPFITGIAGLFTIALGLSQISNEFFLIASPFIVVLVVIFCLWIKKGRDKAIKKKFP
jgi:hypothetical protein